MPSNTSHIQQRAQLKQHDDIVVPPTEQAEWEDVQSERVSIPDIHSMPAPVSTLAVSMPQLHVLDSDN